MEDEFTDQVGRPIRNDSIQFRSNKSFRVSNRQIIILATKTTTLKREEPVEQIAIRLGCPLLLAIVHLGRLVVI